MCIPELISKLKSPKCTMIAAYNDTNNIDFKQDCVHIHKYINKHMAKNFGTSAIVKMERPDVAPAAYAQIQCCQPTSAAVERSFSMLGKLLSKDIFYQQTWKGISVCISTNCKYKLLILLF